MGNSHLLEQTIKCFTSPYQVFLSILPCCSLNLLLVLFSLRTRVILPLHCLCSSFYILEKKSSSFSPVCVQQYSPVAFLCRSVSEPPGTLAWPTKINSAKPRKVLCHFSELNWLTKKSPERDGPFWGEAFHCLDNYGEQLRCPDHCSVFYKFSLIAQSFVWRVIPQLLW